MCLGTTKSAAMAAFIAFSVETSDRPVRLRNCDCAGCGQPGDFRAPKSRDRLMDYFWFCLDHVRDYNRHWDYFAGMSMREIETYVRSATVWDRPSWPLGQAGNAGASEQKLRDKAMDEFFAEGVAPPPSSPASPVLPKAERDALTALELAPPTDLTAIKTRYRLMVKRYHPDLHGGSRAAEEKFKSINQAFTLLRQIYGATGASESR